MCVLGFSKIIGNEKVRDDLICMDSCGIYIANIINRLLMGNSVNCKIHCILQFK